MSKKKSVSKKYYAIKVGKNTTNKIVTTWSECKAIVHGYPSIYKSFQTKEEALEYLGSIKDVNKKLENISKAIENKKSKRSNTVAITNLFKGVRIDKTMADDFINKCTEFDTTADKMLIELIKDWTY